MRDGMGPGTGVAGVIAEINADTVVKPGVKLYFRDTGVYITSDASGAITISANGAAGNTVRVKLNDKAGGTNFSVEDSEGFPMGQIDSDGNLKHKGTVKRTTTN